MHTSLNKKKICVHRDKNGACEAGCSSFTMFPWDSSLSSDKDPREWANGWF